MKKQILTLMFLLVFATGFVSAGWWSDFWKDPFFVNKGDIQLSPSSRILTLDSLETGITLKKGKNGPYLWNDKDTLISEAVKELNSLNYIQALEPSPLQSGEDILESFINEENIPMRNLGNWYPENGQLYQYFHKYNVYFIYVKKASTWKYSQQSYCVDNDDGLNYGANSLASDSTGRIIQDGCIISNAENNGFLRESICNEDNKAIWIDYDCSKEGKVCKDGACVASSSPSNESSSSEVTYQGVLEMLNKECTAYEMGSGEIITYFNKSFATGNDICNQRASGSTCVLAGRVYSLQDYTQTGYGIWRCSSEVVSSDMNGWALCCSAP